MGVSACPKCEDLCATRAIRSPAELTDVLNAIREHLADGTLVEAAYWPQGQVELALPSFVSIPPSGPWPDYIQYYFSCATCSQLYRLSVETYHGAGGKWSSWESGEDDA